MAPTPRIAHEAAPQAGSLKQLRTLVLIRHGHALQGAEDKLRPLSEEGRRQLVQAAAELRALPPQRLVCSSATRTRQSAELLCAQLGLTINLELQSGLYLASPQVILDCVTTTPSAVGTCWVVGHNPGLSELVRRLSHTTLDLNTSEAAILRFRGEWSELGNCPCELAGANEALTAPFDESAP
jgi:phosphohistidine phosphatase